MPTAARAARNVTAARPDVAIRCATMTAATKGDAESLLAEFLRGDDHYLASSPAYGDGGAAALVTALDLFLARPELGFVWLAIAESGETQTVVGACVVCYAISTSRGTLVAKLDDVTIARESQDRGIGTAMLAALADHLRAQGITRIDCSCHRDNTGAWRFYERNGYKPLDEERIALLL